MEFSDFRDAVKNQIEKMSEHDLFEADVSSEELWQTYLQSFPAGSNPVFRERTVHDCSCCRQFIRDAGAMVAIVDGEIVTPWDICAEGHFGPEGPFGS